LASVRSTAVVEQALGEAGSPSPQVTVRQWAEAARDPPPGQPASADHK
jgi:hypothetical protein